METIFTVRNDDLARLSPGESVELFRELLWAEGRRIGIPISQSDIIGFEHFSLFGYGGVLKDLSEQVFQILCAFLLDYQKYAAISITLDLHFIYYLHKTPKPPLPEELTLRVLTHKSLFKKPEIGRRGQMDEYHWTGIGKAFVHAFPQRALELADIMLEHFNEDETILDGFFSQTQAVLNEITKKYPAEVWERIRKYLTPPIDRRGYSITEWLRGGEHFKEREGGLSLLPDEKIWDWVNEDIDEHAWYLATFVPKRLFREEGKHCLARELLIRYGTREDVRRNLKANFSSEGWSGPASLHYRGKRDWLLDFKKQEDNENVKLWIDEYVAGLDRAIEEAKIEEERRF